MVARESVVEAKMIRTRSSMVVERPGGYERRPPPSLGYDSDVIGRGVGWGVDGRGVVARYGCRGLLLVVMLILILFRDVGGQIAPIREGG